MINFFVSITIEVSKEVMMKKLFKAGLACLLMTSTTVLLANNTINFNCNIDRSFAIIFTNPESTNAISTLNVQAVFRDENNVTLTAQDPGRQINATFQCSRPSAEDAMNNNRRWNCGHDIQIPIPMYFHGAINGSMAEGKSSHPTIWAASLSRTDFEMYFSITLNNMDGIGGKSDLYFCPFPVPFLPFNIDT